MGAATMVNQQRNGCVTQTSAIHQAPDILAACRGGAQLGHAISKSAAPAHAKVALESFSAFNQYQFV